MAETRPRDCESTAEALARVPGVVAVVLGGSWARGVADAHSDVDIGIYYRRERPPAIEALRQAARTLDPACELTEYGEWGPWVNGGGWLTIDGRAVDWLYRDLMRVREVLADCLAGRVTCDYSLGHPHGFHSSYYLAELHHCVSLHDPSGAIVELKQAIEPYPAMLRQTILEKYLYDGAFTLEAAEKHLPRADVLHTTGSLFRAAASLVQVIFALNRRWLMNEKRAVEQIASGDLPLVPDAFAERVEAVLASPGGDEVALRESVGAMRELLEETRALAPPLRYEWGRPGSA